jgi:acylphosphatase
MAEECRVVVYTGNVQGVGFRYTAHNIARRFAVTGTVRNLPDGGVEIMAEGESAEIDGFLADVRDAMSPYIRNESVSREPGTGHFESFSIRHG